MGQVLALVEALASNRWIDWPPALPATLDGGTLATILRRDSILAWPVACAAAPHVRYPLEPPPDVAEAFFELQLHWSHDHVYRAGEAVDPFGSVECRCGRSLEHWPGDDDVFLYPRLHATCPGCATPFEPSELEAVVRDPFTGEDLVVRGGMTSRFALAIDCNKCLGPWRERPRLSPDLVELCRGVLGCELYEIGEIH